MKTFKDWLVLREEQAQSLLNSKVKPGDEDDNDALMNQAKAAIANSVGQPGTNGRIRATQLRRIAQASANKKGVKLKSVLNLAKTADELAKADNPLMQQKS